MKSNFVTVADFFNAHKNLNESVIDFVKEQTNSEHHYSFVFIDNLLVFARTGGSSDVSSMTVTDYSTRTVFAIDILSNIKYRWRERKLVRTTDRGMISQYHVDRIKETLHSNDEIKLTFCWNDGTEEDTITLRLAGEFIYDPLFWEKSKEIEAQIQNLLKARAKELSGVVISEHACGRIFKRSADVRIEDKKFNTEVTQAEVKIIEEIDSRDGHLIQTRELVFRVSKDSVVELSRKSLPYK
ncbi:MAG: hypothetical protein Q8K92_15105 [Leadbetterella sp.]|nr:hypothetical protein [Leadbetterella sp.]